MLEARAPGRRRFASAAAPETAHARRHRQVWPPRDSWRRRSCPAAHGLPDPGPRVPPASCRAVWCEGGRPADRESWSGQLRLRPGSRQAAAGRCPVQEEGIAGPGEPQSARMPYGSVAHATREPHSPQRRASSLSPGESAEAGEGRGLPSQDETAAPRVIPAQGLGRVADDLLGILDAGVGGEKQ